MWFVPNSALTDDQLREMPTQVATRYPVAFLNVVEYLSQITVQQPVSITTIPQTAESSLASETLKDLFNKFGSDKSTVHNYHLIYGLIFNLIVAPLKILEIGLGSNNVDIASNMGAHGSPGASLRAFKNFCPLNIVHGADIDKSISVDGCKVFFVDQTIPSSFNLIHMNGEAEYDLIIDDGLHSPDANLITLLFALKHISPRGFVVIEDIPERSLPIWKSIQLFFSQTKFRSAILQTKAAYVFIVTPRSSLFGL